jgi:hypothetical protein
MDNESKARTYGGVAVLAAMITGFAALVLASTSVKNGHFEGAGIALVAAAVAFVGVAQTIFRR